MADLQQKTSGAFNERMRLIRLRRKKEDLRFWEEFRLVPNGLIWTMVALYVIALAIALSINYWNFHHNPGETFGDLYDMPYLSYLALAGVITAVGLVLSCFVFLIGYVNRDARRRGMNSALWTLLVIVMLPSLAFVGFLIYFLMRDPLPYPCPQCGKLVGPRFNFCPNCKCNLHPSCPNCKREVGESDKYCPYCAHELGHSKEAGTALESIGESRGLTS
jgi:hypothetical protein